VNVGLLAACVDPALLRLDPWPVQRRLLAAVEAGPRVHVWALGRRSGKTTAAAVALVWDALLRPGLDRLVRPGERRYAVGVATSLRQARLLVSAARSLVEHSPLLAPLVESSTEDELAFVNGATIAAFPCTSRGGRGWPISLLVLDELAHFVDTEGNSAAETVWRALTPSVAQFGAQARVIASSTPWGQDGLFATLYAQASSGELVDAAAQHATTREANPTISAEVLAAEEARDPDGFRSEYGAEFVGGGASFLDPERIAAAVTLPGELAPEQAAGWVAGLDPSFARDPFGLALVGRDPGDRDRLLAGRVQAWQPRRIRGAGGAFEQRREVEDTLLAEVAAVCRRYGARVVTDQYAAPAVVERLRRAGLRVRTVAMTAASKTEAFAELRARLNAGSLGLYEQPELLAELRRLRTRYTAGAASVVNPRVGGSHGDMAQALALAVFEHGSGGGPRPASLHVASGPLLPEGIAAAAELPLGRPRPWLG
jgi:hypothetical protein